MRKWMLMVLATIFLGAVVLILLLNRGADGEVISAEEAGTKVVKLYGGKVQETLPAGDYYEVKFSREDGQYTAEVDKQSGQVASVELNKKTEIPKKLTEEEASAIALKEAEGEVGEVVYSKDSNEFKVEVKGVESISTVIVAADSGEIRKITNQAVETDPLSKPLISPDKAIEVAKKTLDGEVSEVEFVESEDGGYYLVDIDKEETDQEVLVTVHAIRGDTMTVEWDD
ncbi:PepSY domain-containing protein [Planococcus sp. N028]|uniref:PepSY domain-containing protein n=1 Tax=Planococcus shixiaomingii TaxID=3058393 RepID=A0ABT8N0L8_9BACL|nr:PepSY domain-containing protein [Planococcus sp. N028]MDN7241441.1 PepSY domain-containing protein [Planococcus sp. N028]